MGAPASYKRCPSCGTPALIDASSCLTCGHVYRTKFQPLPPAAPTPPTQAFPPPAHPYTPPSQPYASPYGQGQSPYGTVQHQDPAQNFRLDELAEQYRALEKTFLWTLYAGLLCLFPIWIVSAIQFQKMSQLKREVASMGVNTHYWITNYVRGRY
jgi:hypothetical protein